MKSSAVVGDGTMCEYTASRGLAAVKSVPACSGLVRCEITRSMAPKHSMFGLGCGGSGVELAPDFSEFCALLSAHRVEFVIVGAHALAFHGAPRFTGDLDILVRPTAENGQRLVDDVAAFGFPSAGLTRDSVINPRTVVEMGVPPVQLHVMSAVDGVTWDEVWEGREAGPLRDRRTLPTSRR